MPSEGGGNGINTMFSLSIDEKVNGDSLVLPASATLLCDNASQKEKISKGHMDWVFCLMQPHWLTRFLMLIRSFLL